MKNCEFVTLISILSCSIAKDKTPEEVSILAAFFTQIRRYFSYTCYSRRKYKFSLLILHID